MKILAVDDEKLALETLVDSVGKVLPDAEVSGFRNPGDAVEHVKDNYCEIAFLDIKMRGISGLELARRLKDIQGDINIVFVTGYSEYALDAFRLYASDYLLKPSTPEAVKKALDHLRTPVKPVNGKKIRFQCFGAFEVFYCDKPLVFKRAKAKELLAYLVDRMGAAVTMGELMSVLWEDGRDTLSRRSNLRNLISDVKRTLAKTRSEE
ncbi:MAG: response regulator, partial [Candidatus Scatosoma sp.]